VQYDELKTLLTHLYGMFGDRIFRWGSEQTMHGLTRATSLFIGAET
jgi:hypothetical protein